MKIVVAMMIENLLFKPEGKTLEFKENASSPLNLIKTVVAFANTAGGTIVLGVKDKTKEVLGINNILQEEERLANIISDAIEPLLIPDLEIMNYQGKELIIINVPYLTGPYFFKKAGLEKGVYIRLGSTNRLADIETIAYLQRLAKQISFDEIPCVGAKLDELDHEFLVKMLRPFYKKLDKSYYQSLGLTASHHDKMYPTYGGLLLFSQNKSRWLPDSTIRCVCFAGTTREQIIDQKDIASNLITAVKDTIAFINRHTNIAAQISAVKKEDVVQFPPKALSEVVINAIVHADYAMKGAAIQIAVFSDRIEFTNPGSLPFGQTLESALSGISRMRNRVIGRIFRELKLIERLGSGLPRTLEIYKSTVAKMPLFEEINNHFRVTLYAVPITFIRPKEKWMRQLLRHLAKDKSLSTNQISQLWHVTDRTARMRLKMMTDRGLVQRKATSKNDPKATYSKI